jgi:hypothetical protein
MPPNIALFWSINAACLFAGAYFAWKLGRFRKISVGMSADLGASVILALWAACAWFAGVPFVLTYPFGFIPVADTALGFTYAAMFFAGSAAIRFFWPEISRWVKK